MPRGVGIYVWRAIKDRCNNRCVYCDRRTYLQLEHLVPRSRGGDNSPENLAAACAKCNTRKGPLMPLEFFFKIPKSLIRWRN